MNYLLSQIWICLLLTALVAGLAGWFLRGGGKAKLKAIEDKWKIKLARAENERDYYAGEVKSFSSISQEKEDLEKNHLLEKEQMSKQLEEMQMGASTASEKIKENEKLLQTKAQELENANSELLAKKEEEYQGFTQQLSEAETAARQSEDLLKQSEQRSSKLQSELDETKIKLSNLENRLSEVADNRNDYVDSADDNSGKSKVGLAAAGVGAGAMGIAGMVADKFSTKDADEVTNDLSDDILIDDSPVENIDEVSTSEARLDYVDMAEEEKQIEEVTSTDSILANDMNADEHSHSTDDTQDISSATDDSSDTKVATAAAGAGALGFAGMVADKFNHAKDELFDRVDPDDDNYGIQDVHTINIDESKRLIQMNIDNTETLLDKCSSKEGIQLVAKSMGKESWVVRSWVSVADLMRVKGIDSINAELLELAGVSSVQALKASKIDKLADSIKVIHKHVGKTSYIPTKDDIGSWIKQASELPTLLDDNLDKL